MKNRFAISIITIIVLFTAVVLPVKAEDVAVRVDKVKTDSIEEVRIVNGKVEPSKTVRLSAKITGLVDKLNVQMGDFVEKGETLVVFDKDELEAQVEQAEAGLQAAKSNLTRLKKGASKEDIKASLAGVKQAEASLKRAQAQYEMMKEGATEEELQQARSSYQQSVASFKGAEKSLEVIKEMYNDKTSLKQQLTSAEMQLKSAEKQWESAQKRHEQSKINLKQAENNLEQTEKEYNRMKNLYEQNVVTEKQFEMAESQYNNAKLTVDNARSAVESSRIAMQQAKISYEGAQESHDLSEESFNDPIQLKQQLESARTQLEVARANRDIAKANLSKVKKGAREGEIQSSLASVKQAEAALERAKANHAKLKNGASEEEISSSEAQVKQAEVSLKLAQMRLDDTVIKSPISGYIATVNIEEGEMIGPGNPIINVVSLNPLYVNSGVSPQVVKNIKAGDEVKVDILAFRNMEKKGIIKMVSPTLNPQTQSFPVKVKVENKGNEIKGGMFADIHFTLAQQKEAVIIPINAVSYVDGVPYTYVINNGKAVKRELELGLINDDKAEVLSGVQSGETVVIQGQSSLQDGDSVEVVNR